MSTEMKLFRVVKMYYPEWGQSQEKWEKFLLCRDRDTLESVLRDRYGNLKQYYRGDRGSEVIEITECDLEVL